MLYRPAQPSLLARLAFRIASQTALSGSTVQKGQVESKAQCTAKCLRDLERYTQNFMVHQKVHQQTARCISGQQKSAKVKECCSKTSFLEHAPPHCWHPGESLESPEVVSLPAAGALPSTRAGGQDDVSSQANSLKQGMPLHRKEP